jgi:hypothetical protein
MSTACPHCGVLTAPEAMFCASCGKAVRVGPQATRIVNDQSLAATHAGQSLQSEVLRKQMKSAFGALLTVAILQTLGAGLLAIAAANLPVSAGERSEFVAMAAITGVIALGFYGLAFWARIAPLPAAITGLCILLTLWLIGAIIDPTTIVQGLIIKIIIVVLLVRAIKAGALHRRLSRELTIQQAAAV